MMDGNRIVDVFDDFSPEKFIDVVELLVNSFSFDTKGTATELASMPKEKQALLWQAIDSCIYTLAHTDRIDGRNEISAETCRKLNPAEDPMPEIGACFLRVHPTLQQSSMKLFCCYLDKTKDVGRYTETIEALRNEYGDRWYCFPLI